MHSTRLYQRLSKAVRAFGPTSRVYSSLINGPARSVQLPNVAPVFVASSRSLNMGMSSYPADDKTCKEVVRDYCSDMSTVEKHTMESLSYQLSSDDLAKFPDAKQLVQRIYDTLGAHVETLDQHLKDHVGTGAQVKSSIKEAIGSVLGAAAGIYNKIRLAECKVTCMLRDNYTALGLVAVSYECLQVVALGAKDQQLADIATRQMREISPLIVELSQNIVRVVAKELMEAGRIADANVADEALKRSMGAWSADNVGKHGGSFSAGNQQWGNQASAGSQWRSESVRSKFTWAGQDQQQKNYTDQTKSFSDQSKSWGQQCEGEQSNKFTDSEKTNQQRWSPSASSPDKSLGGSMKDTYGNTMDSMLSHDSPDRATGGVNVKAAGSHAGAAETNMTSGSGGDHFGNSDYPRGSVGNLKNVPTEGNNTMKIREKVQKSESGKQASFDTNKQSDTESAL